MLIRDLPGTWYSTSVWNTDTTKYRVIRNFLSWDSSLKTTTEREAYKSQRMRVGLLFVITCVLGGVFVKASPLRSLRNQPVKMEPQHRHIISNTTAGSSNALLPVFGSRSMTSQKSRRFLNAVVLVAGGNLVFNTVRYDPSIKWQVRFCAVRCVLCWAFSPLINLQRS